MQYVNIFNGKNSIYTKYQGEGIALSIFFWGEHLSPLTLSVDAYG